jgi:hypothetical protein
MSSENEKQWSDLLFEHFQEIPNERKNHSGVDICQLNESKGHWASLPLQEGINYETASTPEFPVTTDVDFPPVTAASWLDELSCTYRVPEDDGER